MQTRNPLLADTLGYDLLPTAPAIAPPLWPAVIPTNDFPYQTFFAFDRVHVTSVGWDGSPAAESGTAMVQAFNWWTGAKEQEHHLGPYYGGNQTWINGATGICAAGGYLIVCNQLGDRVLRIDPKTYQLIGPPLNIGAAPCHPCIDRDGGLWVTARSAGKVVKVDPISWSILGEVAELGAPFRMARFDKYMLVAGYSMDKLYWIDTTVSPISEALVHETGVGSNPNDICVEVPHGDLLGYAYVSNKADALKNSGDCVSRVRLDTKMVDATFALPNEAQAHGVYAVNDLLVAIGSATNKVHVLNKSTGELLYDIPVGADPSFGCFAPDGVLWLANPLANCVRRILFRSIWA